MRYAGDQVKLERRLRQRWLAQVPKGRRSRVAWKSLFDFVFLRCIFLGFSLIPFPQAWGVAVFLATSALLARATQLTSRGMEEFVIALYGAGDREIRCLSRRWLGKLGWINLLDASVYLGIWWVTGRIPWWVVALGMPCYVAAATAGVPLMARIVPQMVLGWGAHLLFFGMLGILYLRFEKNPEIVDSLIWTAGVLSPVGWTILMLRDVAEGQYLLLFVIPLLVAVCFLALRVSRIQTRNLLAIVHRAGEPIPVEAKKPPEAVSPVGESLRDRSRVDFSEELARQRGAGWFDQSKAISWRGLAWNFLILLSLVLNACFPVFLDNSFRYVLVAGALAMTHVIWLPILGQSVWLDAIPISMSRLVSAFAVFPITLRMVLIAQIRQDLRTVVQRGPILVTLSILIVSLLLPEGGLPAVLLALFFSLFFLLKVPLCWAQFAAGALSRKPFGWFNIVNVLLMLVVLMSMFAEVLAGVFFLVSVNQGEDFGTVAAIVFLMSAALSTGSGLLRMYLAMRAYDGGWLDLTRIPAAK